MKPKLEKVTASEVNKVAQGFQQPTYFHSPGCEFGHELQTFVPFVHGLGEAGIPVIAVSKYPSIYFSSGLSISSDTTQYPANARHFKLDISNPDDPRYKRVFHNTHLGKLFRLGSSVTTKFFLRPIENVLPNPFVDGEHKPLSGKIHGQPTSFPWLIWHPQDVTAAMKGKLPLWQPPSYKKLFSNQRFVFEREPLIVQNKYATEPWKHFDESGVLLEQPYNFIPVDVLDRLFNYLKKRYQIIYNRYLETIDNSQVLDFDDYQLISQQHQEVLTISDLARDNNLSYDETQLMVYANAKNFIGVQGGGSLLIHYFGGRSVIFHRFPQQCFEQIMDGKTRFTSQMEIQESGNFYKTLFPCLSGQQIEPCYDLDSFERLICSSF